MNAVFALDYRWTDPDYYWWDVLDERWWYRHLEIMPSWMVAKVKRMQ